MKPISEHRMKPIQDINKLKTGFKNQKDKKYDSTNIFFKQYYDGLFLFFNVTRSIKKKKDQHLIDLAFNNYLVNCITCLEIFYKHMIQSFDRWSEQGYTELLTEKVTLGQAFDLIGNEKITKQYIIANHYSFQNFSTIGKTMSALTQKDFYKEVENYEVTYIGGTKEGKLDPTDTKTVKLIKDYPDWKKTINKLYEDRNNFVHDGIILSNEKKLPHKINEILTAYVSAANLYVMYSYFKSDKIKILTPEEFAKHEGPYIKTEK